MSGNYSVQVFIPNWDALDRDVNEGYWNTVSDLPFPEQALSQKAALSEYYVQVRVIQKAHTIIEEKIIG